MLEQPIYSSSEKRPRPQLQGRACLVQKLLSLAQLILPSSFAPFMCSILQGDNEELPLSLFKNAGKVYDYLQGTFKGLLMFQR